MILISRYLTMVLYVVSNFNILLFFSLGQSFAEEIYKTSFKVPVTGKSETTNCNFSIHFTDTDILGNSRFKCDRIKKPMLINSFSYELKSSMHILRQALKKTCN